MMRTILSILVAFPWPLQLSLQSLFFLWTFMPPPPNLELIILAVSPS